MIAAFSTSSAQVSVCLIGASGDILWSGEHQAPGRASGTCLALLESGLAECGAEIWDCKLFAADVGPGSFTGVRVGVVLAKTLAWTVKGKCLGATSFDLIDSETTVALPSKKGEFFIRVPGTEPTTAEVVPLGVKGYGFEGGTGQPHANGFAPLVGLLVSVQPELFVPSYVLSPSISQSKRPLSRLEI